MVSNHAQNNTIMKQGIHPEHYRFVVFKDMSNETMFLSRSAAQSKETIVYEEHLTFVVRIQTNNTVCNNLTKHFSLQNQLCLTFVII